MKGCQANLYKDNMVVTHGALMCWGGFGDKPCRFLKDCVTDWNMKLTRKQKRLFNERFGGDKLNE